LPDTLTVDLGDRSYPIVIGRGLLDDYELQSRVTGPAAIVVSNETVAPLYRERLERRLAGKRLLKVDLPDGEAHKTLESVSRILDELAGGSAGRDTTVLALGGGVVGDIAGFAAACYMRGVPLIQVPTTLLAQVDSSVGGKTGVNHPRGKNLIGAFHQPQLVLIDTDTLSTLPDREFRAGLAEVIKHAAIADPVFFRWLEDNMSALVAHEPAALAHAIRRCCEIKADVVAADERERGQRALLNFGHTFGHAIEASVGYGEWLHGEAVAAGMIMAAALSAIDESERRRLADLVRRAGLPVAPPDVPAETLRVARARDKKILGDRLRFVLLRRLGEAYVDAEVPEERLAGVLATGAA